jgi:hypothetical protein
MTNEQVAVLLKQAIESRGIIDCTGDVPVVRLVRSFATNTNGPIYGTAMMIGETVMVLAAKAAMEGGK